MSRRWDLSKVIFGDALISGCFCRGGGFDSNFSEISFIGRLEFDPVFVPDSFWHRTSRGAACQFNLFVRLYRVARLNVKKLKKRNLAIFKRSYPSNFQTWTPRLKFWQDNQKKQYFCFTFHQVGNFNIFCFLSQFFLTVFEIQ